MVLYISQVCIFVYQKVLLVLDKLEQKMAEKEIMK